MKRVEFHESQSPQWKRKTSTVMLQFTKSGYPHLNLPVDSVRQAGWSPDSVIDVSVDRKGRIILTDLRR